MLPHRLGYFVLGEGARALIPGRDFALRIEDDDGVIGQAAEEAAQHGVAEKERVHHHPPASARG